MPIFSRLLHRTLLSILCILLFAATSYAETYFVDPSGRDATSADGISSPWKTITYALTKAKRGDLISINDGVYTEGQLVVPEGVSITSSSRDNTKVRIQPKQDLGTGSPLMRLASTSPGADGSQTISYLELAGINGGISAKKGILVQNRNNVRIHHCYIHDFKGVYDSIGVEALSTGAERTADWWRYWPADAQSPGNDANIAALWPSNPVLNFELDHNVIYRCGFKDSPSTGGDMLSPAVRPFHLKNSSIHNNTIDCDTSYGQPIWACVAFLWNVDIYDNDLSMVEYKDRSRYAIEIWVLRSCNIYKNNSTAGFSITMGKETRVYENNIVFDPIATPYGRNADIGIEFIRQSYGDVYKNYISGAGWYGIDWGQGPSGNSRNWISEHTKIRHNVIHNTYGYGIGVFAEGGRGTPGNNITRYGYVHHNVIDGQKKSELGSAISRTLIGIHLKQEENVGVGQLHDIYVRNNTIMDVTGTAIISQGHYTNISVEANIFHNNENNYWHGGQAIKTYTSDPNFQQEGAGFYGYTPQEPSDAIDNGVHIDNLAFSGNGPDLGAVEVGMSEGISPPTLRILLSN